MKCPLQKITIGKDRDCVDVPYFGNCIEDDCHWWDSKANFNPKTKQFEGQCCILTLSRLKISGGINTHPG